MTMRRAITVACWDYDRTVALADGRVRPEGLDVTYLPLLPAETFFRALRHHEFDVAEMSLSSYVLNRDREDSYIATPAFPSRSFRHNGIYINTACGISGPADLIGCTVGLPEYQVTAAVWIRGILAEHHGVPVNSVAYRTGGIHDPRRTEKIPVSPPGIDLKPVPPGRVLSDLLVTGEIQAMYTPRVPRSFLQGRPEVARLWPDSRAMEQDYYRATGIFPIMHTIVIRRELYERDPWIARSLYDAFVVAKDYAIGRLRETGAPASSLPWAYAEAEDAIGLMSEDFWPYGLAANEKVLATFMRYSHDQGLASRVYEPSELFAPETFESFAL